MTQISLMGNDSWSYLCGKVKGDPALSPGPEDKVLSYLIQRVMAGGGDGILGCRQRTRSRVPSGAPQRPHNAPLRGCPRRLPSRPQRPGQHGVGIASDGERHRSNLLSIETYARATLTKRLVTIHRDLSRSEQIQLGKGSDTDGLAEF